MPGVRLPSTSRLVSLGSPLLLSLAVSACGSSGDTDGSSGATSKGAGGSGSASASTGSDGTGGDGIFTVGDHPDPPQVVNLGGKVLTAPSVVPVFFQGDANQADVVKFLGQMAASPYWAATTSEYGVGALTVKPAVAWSMTAPASFSDTPLIAGLRANLTGTQPAWGTPDANTIYLFVFPKGTTFLSDGTSCEDFDGYHDETTVNGMKIAYAIATECDGFGAPGVADFDELTTTISHELIEASTDPFPNSGPAFVQTDDAHAIWTVETDGEVADMCEFNPEAYAKLDGIDHFVQRIWSNAAAKKGANPCVPALDGAYFSADPVLTDNVDLNYYGQWATHGVKIPVGSSKTIDVQLWSSSATKAWKVTAYDAADYLGTGKKHLDLSWDKDTGSNGDTLHLTIKVLSADSSISGEAFMIESDDSTGKVGAQSWGFVAN